MTKWPTRAYSWGCAIQVNRLSVTVSDIVTAYNWQNNRSKRLKLNQH